MLAGVPATAMSRRMSALASWVWLCGTSAPAETGGVDQSHDATRAKRTSRHRPLPRPVAHQPVTAPSKAECADRPVERYRISTDPPGLIAGGVTTREEDQ